MRSTIQALVLLGLFALLAGAMLTLFHPLPGAALFTGGFALLLWMYFVNRRHQARVAEARAAEVESRAARATIDVHRLGRTFSVSDSGWMVALRFSVVLLVVGLGYLEFTVFSVEPFRPDILAVGALMFCGGLLYFFLGMLPWIGQPLVVLSRNGMQTPRWKSLPWEEIYGIELREVAIRGHKSHILRFFVPALERFVEQAHPIERFCRGFRTKEGRKQIAIGMKGTTEYPEVVFRVAMDLWKRATGRDYPWHSEMPEEMTMALSRASEAMRMLDALGKQENVDHDALLRQADLQAENLRIAMASLKRGRISLFKVRAVVAVMLVIYLVLSYLQVTL